MATADLYSAVPGPADREDFSHAQRRHRRASWRFSMASGLATFVMGIPLSAVVSPLVVAGALIGMDVVNIATPIADPFKNYNGDSPTIHTTAQYVAIAAGLLIPGAIVLFVAWLAVRRLFRRSVTGSGVLLLGARDPNPGDLEERQLANLVGEMAAAAGIPPPAFRLIDSEVPNAAIVGSSLDDTLLVVTTGLLDVLDRDETQAVVGQLVGAAGNGDLKIGMTLLSVFLTFGAVSSFLGAPADRVARHRAWRLMRLPFKRRRDPAFETTLLEDLLADKTDPAAGEKTGCMSMVFLPFIMTSGAFMMNRLIFQPFLVNPFLKRRWRARRYLADASAVELTRNPTALAEALTKLGPLQATVPGTEWMSHLFIIGGPERPGVGIADLHAPVPKRLERLIRLGAEVELPAKPARPRLRDVQFGELLSSKAGCLTLLVLLFAIPFLILVVPIMWACALAITAITFAIDGMFLAPMVGLIHVGLRAIGR